jgi:hypothetical protein
LGALALLLDTTWIKERAFVLVTAYVDESGTGGEPRVMLAAFVGRLGRWHGFNGHWERLLKREEIPFSHLTAMKKREHPFEAWDDARIAAFLPRTMKIVKDHCDFGLTVAVDIKAHREAYRQKMPPKTSADSDYGLCARTLFSYLPTYVEKVLGLRHPCINVVMERHDQRFGDAQRIFYELKNTYSEMGEKLGTITPGEKHEFAGLQAADILAFQGRRKEPVTRFFDIDDETTIATVRKRTGALCPVFHIPIGADNMGLFHKDALVVRRQRIRTKAARKAIGD